MVPMSKKIHKIQKKRYADLRTFAREIVDSGVEKINSFDGCTIRTNKNRYTMVDSTIYVNGEAHGTG